MYVKIDLDDFNALKNNSWSGAIDTLNEVYSHDKEDELMDLIEDVFCGEVPTETEVNDFLWFESDYIYECLGINEDDEDDEEEE